MNQDNNKQQGFTLVELTLAMTFISVLLLSIALTIIQLGALYNQGTTSKEINQASRDMQDNITRNIASSGPFVFADDYVLVPNAANPASPASNSVSGARIKRLVASMMRICVSALPSSAGSSISPASRR